MCYISFKKWQCFQIVDMINWQHFLNLAKETEQCIPIVTISKHCLVQSTQFGNVALFLRTRFGNIAIFSSLNLGSIASSSCPKLGNIATF